MKSGSNVDDELAKEASKGLLGKSNLRSGERFDAIKFDYVPATKVEMRRSKSQPGMKASLFHLLITNNHLMLHFNQMNSELRHVTQTVLNVVTDLLRPVLTKIS